MNEPALSDVLRLCARPDHASNPQPLADAAARLTGWEAFAAAAEAHGLAPLAYSHLTQAGVAIPLGTKQRLLASVLIHREANRARFRALGEILDAFEAADIQLLVLKGAALAHILYPSAGLRPLSDLDLLVAPRQASRAQAVLVGLGYKTGPLPARRHLGLAHHLPPAVKFSERHQIQVEIHTNALTRDTPGSLSMDDLTEAPQEFLLEGRTARALGHADMLYHLCRHTAEPSLLLRLMWVADVVGYATRYREAIPWTDVRRRYPFVLNALSLLHLVTPLPRELAEYVTPSPARGLSGVGVACKPLTAILKQGRPASEVRRDLFDPSDWWLRLYYGAGERSPLWWYRGIRHPIQVGYWLARRAAETVRRRA